MTPAAAPGSGDEALVAYRGLLDRYHRTLDLLSPVGYADLERHLAEAERYAVAVAELAAEVGPVIDLGSGAGLPGVIVAARLAPREVWWVERRSRRATFLTQVAAQARLSSVRVIGDDVRRLARPPGGVAAVTAQAVGTLREVAALTRRLWGPRVLLVSRKGPDWRGEIDALGAWWRDDPNAAAKDWATPHVLRAEPLGTRGTLVAVELRGG